MPGQRRSPPRGKRKPRPASAPAGRPPLPAIVRRPPPATQTPEPLFQGLAIGLL
jgi:hypothetical protein